MSRFNGLLKQAIRESKGKLDCFCLEYGHNYQTMSTKLNPNDSKSWVNILELEDIIEHTQDTRILDYFCALFGASWHSVGEIQADHNTTTQNVFKEFGEAIAALSQHVSLEGMNVRDANKLLSEMTEARDAANEKIRVIEQYLQSQVKPYLETNHA